VLPCPAPPCACVYSAARAARAPLNAAQTRRRRWRASAAHLRCCSSRDVVGSGVACPTTRGAHTAALSAITRARDGHACCTPAARGGARRGRTRGAARPARTLPNCEKSPRVPRRGGAPPPRLRRPGGGAQQGARPRVGGSWKGGACGVYGPHGQPPLHSAGGTPSDLAEKTQRAATHTVSSRYVGTPNAIEGTCSVLQGAGLRRRLVRGARSEDGEAARV
jgi:hypothetical protein